MTTQARKPKSPRARPPAAAPDDAREQLAAVSEVLRAMAGSADLERVSTMIADAAARLCAADNASLYRRDGDEWVYGAQHGVSALPYEPGKRMTPTNETVWGRAALDGTISNIADTMTADPPLPNPNERRTRMAVPVLRAGTPIAVLFASRDEPGGFSRREQELLVTFADQAAIAIENARLLNETKDALERQTATAEILRAISGSPTDVAPVLDTIAQSARRYCAAEDAVVLIRDGDTMAGLAHAGPVSSAVRPLPLDRDSVGGRAMIDRQTVHVDDLQTAEDFPFGRKLASGAKHHTTMATPLLRQGEALGAILLRRSTIRPFTDREIMLAETFASQAVIAIENVRLFNETKEALERQTAIGDILRVISQSPTDIQPVLDAIAASAARFAGAEDVSVFIVRGNDAVASAHVGPIETASSVPLDAGSVTGQAILERRLMHVSDVRASDDYPRSKDASLREDGQRAVLSAPLLRDGRALGAIVLRRREPRAFSDRQIELVQTFADQAVIAIANTRLFKDIQEKSAQLEVANRHKTEFLANMSHELRTPLNAIIGFSDVLQQKMFGELNDRQTDYLADIVSSGRHLLSLINDILDLSKIEAGRAELQLTPFSLVAALNNAVTLVRERATSHRIKLELEVTPPLDTIVADERTVKQVVVNLLANAVKFTPDGGSVTVRASAGDGSVRIAVRDTGIGIAPEDQHRIFQEFQQARHQTAQSREGTGLGLTLAKRFVELHGGTLTLESEPGKGSTFTVTLPLVKES